nr:MAG TPA: hypothetical protein [Caudoviricetes sp.]
MVNGLGRIPTQLIFAEFWLNFNQAENISPLVTQQG